MTSADEEGMRMTQESLGSFSMASPSQLIQIGRAFLLKVYSVLKKKDFVYLVSIFGCGVSS